MIYILVLLVTTDSKKRDIEPIQLIMSNSNCSFQVTDASFCSRCGTVLPLPSSTSITVKCRKCQNTVPISGECLFLLKLCIGKTLCNVTLYDCGNFSKIKRNMICLICVSHAIQNSVQ